MLSFAMLMLRVFMLSTVMLRVIVLTVKEP
jgi:hypothetical protein